MLITTTVLQNQPQRYILSSFYWTIMTLSLSKIFVEFSRNPVWFNMVGENFQIYVIQNPRKCIWKVKKMDLGISTHTLGKSHSQVLITIPQPGRKLLIPFRQCFFFFFFSKFYFTQAGKEKLWNSCVLVKTKKKTKAYQTPWSKRSIIKITIIM